MGDEYIGLVTPFVAELHARAEAAMWEAQANKALAEAETARIQGAKYAAEVRFAEQNITNAMLTNRLQAVNVENAERELKSVLSLDVHNCVAHVDEIDDVNVNGIIKLLSVWHRKDPGCAIEIVINTPGGSITDGFALFDYVLWLRSQGHAVTTRGLGQVASMGAVLLQCGDTRILGPSAMMLIHEASFVAYGKSGEVNDTIELTKKMQSRILQILAERSNLSREEIAKRWERRDWWLSADEAMEHGFVDQIG